MNEKFKKFKKYTERKWMVGATSFVLFVIFSLLDANSVLSVPQGVLLMFGGIAATWLITEGILDYTKINQAQVMISKQTTTTEVPVDPLKTYTE